MMSDSAGLQPGLEEGYIRAVLDPDFLTHAQGATGPLADALRAGFASGFERGLAVERGGRLRELWKQLEFALPKTKAFLEAHSSAEQCRRFLPDFARAELWGLGASDRFSTIDQGSGTPLGVSFARFLRRRAELEPTPRAQIAALLAAWEASRLSESSRTSQVLGRLDYDLERIRLEPTLPLHTLRLEGPITWRVDEDGRLAFEGPDALALDPEVVVLLNSERLDGYHGQCANFMVLGKEAHEIRSAHAELCQSGHVDAVSKWFSERDGAYRLHEEVYFQSTPSIMDADLKLAFARRGSTRKLSLPLREGRMALMARLLPLLHGRASAAQIQAALPEQWEFVEQLIGAGVIRRVPRPTPIHIEGYSVSYVAHSCLRFQSPTSSLLIDPLLTVRHLPEHDAGYVLRDRPGAILISHSHWDHYNLDSLMHFDRSTKIVLPALRERASVVNVDMRVGLRDLGFTDIVELDPWQSIWIGDIELVALPYHGEGHGPESPTSWMTYWVKLGGKSVLGLVDACQDDFGSMDTVLRQLRSARGPVDVLFAPCSGYKYPCSSYIYRPFYACRGLGQYTAGHDDVERWAAISGAKRTVPYALFHLRPDEADRDAQLAADDPLRFSSSADLQRLMPSDPQGPLTLMRTGDVLAWAAPDADVRWLSRVES